MAERAPACLECLSRQILFLRRIANRPRAIRWGAAGHDGPARSRARPRSARFRRHGCRNDLAALREAAARPRAHKSARPLLGDDDLRDGSESHAEPMATGQSGWGIRTQLRLGQLKDAAAAFQLSHCLTVQATNVRLQTGALIRCPWRNWFAPKWLHGRTASLS